MVVANGAVGEWHGKTDIGVFIAQAGIALITAARAVAG
jgi:hypothetical protein